MTQFFAAILTGIAITIWSFGFWHVDHIPGKDKSYIRTSHVGIMFGIFLVVSMFAYFLL